MPEEELKTEDFEEDIVSEGAEYSLKSEFPKPKLVYEAMQECIKARSKEMLKGFWNTEITRDGLPIKKWNSDTRQVFISSVIALRSILSPEIKHSKKYKPRIDECEEKIKETKELYYYQEKVLSVENNINVWKNTGRKFIPEIGSKVVITTDIKRNTASEVIGGWDNKTNLYWDVILGEYDKMFAILNDLIDSMNYFKTTSSY